MTALLSNPPNLAPEMPEDKLWTVAEFHQLGEHGFLEGKRAKLIDGRIVVEGPMNPPRGVISRLRLRGENQLTVFSYQ